MVCELSAQWSVSLRLLANLVMYLIDRLVVRIKLERLAIVGFARDYRSLASEVYMNSNVIFDFKTKIWTRHSKTSGTARYPATAISYRPQIHQSAKDPAH
jgi:hypothetical protein